VQGYLQPLAITVEHCWASAVGGNDGAAVSLCRAHDRGGAGVRAAGHQAPPAAAAGVGARALPLPGPGGGAPVAVRRTIRR
jgi:hypothetical protein